MKRKLYFTILSSALFFISGLTSLLHSDEPPLKLKFNDLGTLRHVNGQVVEIRGFLYEDKGGKKKFSLKNLTFELAVLVQKASAKNRFC